MKHFAFVLLIVGFVHSSFAETVVRTDDGEKLHVQIIGESTGVAAEMFLALDAATRDPLDGRSVWQIEGPGYHGTEWTKDPGDMNGQAYTLDFDFDPSANLKFETSGNTALLSFEGRLASTFFQGLYQRRLGQEPYYEMGRSGTYHGDYYIKTRGLGSEMKCQYAYSKKLGKRVASCEIAMALDPLP